MLFMRTGWIITLRLGWSLVDVSHDDDDDDDDDDDGFVC
jgi:hypothetical protein